MAYTWPDGSKNHSISWDRHQANLRAQAYEKSKGNSYGTSFAPASPGSPAAVAAPPPPPVIQPQPFDAAFENSKLGAGFNIAAGNAEAAWQTGETAHATGYNADGSLNTSNPYSQAQLFQDNYARSKTGTNNSMAAAGQLYSGARLNAQAHNDRVYAEGSSAQRDAARNTYHGIGAGQLRNYASNSLGVSQGAFDSLKNSVYGSS